MSLETWWVLYEGLQLWKLEVGIWEGFLKEIIIVHANAVQEVVKQNYPFQEHHFLFNSAITAAVGLGISRLWRRNKTRNVTRATLNYSWQAWLFVPPDSQKASKSNGWKANKSTLDLFVCSALRVQLQLGATLRPRAQLLALRGACISRIKTREEKGKGGTGRMLPEPAATT